MIEEKKEYLAKVQPGGRVTIPIALRNELMLQTGDHVLLSIRRAVIKKAKEPDEG